MPTVFIPNALRHLVDDQESVQVPGSSVREVLNNLDPILREALLEGTAHGSAVDLVKPNLAVAVDGAVAPMGLLERVEAESEIHFIAAISGGA